ncbi:hypothetical protein ABZ547_41090 [Streptomyces sparsogenes]
MTAPTVTVVFSAYSLAPRVALPAVGALSDHRRKAFLAADNHLH